MRLVLPLLSRTILTQNAGLKNSTHSLSKLIDESIWEGVLGASSTIRMIMRTYTIQCIHDGQINLGFQVLLLLLDAEGDSLLRDRFFLHELADVVLSHLKKISHGNSSTNEQLRNGSMWKLFVESFFIDLVEKQTQEAIKLEQVLLIDTDAPDGEDEVLTVKKYEVKYFPVSILHEKLLMLLTQIQTFTELPSSLISNYVKKCLFLLRSGCTLDQFKLLWESPIFKLCREFYEPLIEKNAPELKDQLFIEEGTLKKKKKTEEIKSEETSIVVNDKDDSFKDEEVQVDDASVAQKKKERSMIEEEEEITHKKSEPEEEMEESESIDKSKDENLPMQDANGDAEQKENE
jgi:hypothetical protein